MKKPDTTKCTPAQGPIDKFLDEIDKKMQAEGYPTGLIKNMRQSPEMMDILARIISAELEAVKAE